jgi:hypothetical protein
LAPKALHTGATEGTALGVDDVGASGTEIDAELTVRVVIVAEETVLDELLMELLGAAMLDDGISRDEDGAIDVDRDSLVGIELDDDAIVLAWLLTEAEGD